LEGNSKEGGGRGFSDPLGGGGRKIHSGIAKEIPYEEGMTGGTNEKRVLVSLVTGEDGVSSWTF